VARKRKKKKPSKFEAMLERYGTAAFVTWFGIFFSSIGLFYVLLEVGTDVNALVETVVGWWGGDPSAWTDASAGAGQLALAYLATQVVKPVRIALFVALTPIVGRFMGIQKKADEPAAAPATENEASAETAEPAEDAATGT
jgi:hypothetical protein